MSGAYCDSRRYRSGGIFFIKGRDFKQTYLDDVRDKGCKVYFSERKIPGCVLVSDIRCAMACISRVAWGRPDETLEIIGITGTKGKTTVATYLREILERSGEKCGFIGTHQVFDGRDHIVTDNTTPEAPEVYEHLASMVENGCKYCVMEVSSQALKYNRLGDMHIRVACITNIGIDHISEVEHPTLSDYVKAKFLISNLADKLVVNDRLALLSEVEGLVEEQLKLHKCGTIVSRTRDDIELSMLGEFNKSNASLAMTICELLGVDESVVRDTLKVAKVSGRMEITTSSDGRLVAVVDYAHTKESYEKFFSAIDERYLGYYKIAYFGASGGKATSRKVDLPKTASKYCNFIIITSDDPGDEDRRLLCDQVASHLELDSDHYLVEENRDLACEMAFKVAVEKLREHPHVIVCALGKGDEDVCIAKPQNIPIIPDTIHVKAMIEKYDEQL